MILFVCIWPFPPYLCKEAFFIPTLQSSPFFFLEWTLIDGPKRGCYDALFMEPITEQPTPSTLPQDGAVGDLAPPTEPPVLVAPDIASLSEPGEADQPSEPSQEMADEDLPRDIKPGAMGGERILLMQLLGLDVNHPFDKTVEEELLLRCPDYTGVVDKKIWRELFKENPVKV